MPGHIREFNRLEPHSRESRWVIDMSAASYKMTEMIPSTSAHLIDRSEDVIFELVWVIKRSILLFPVYITKKNVKSVTDSAVLHWTTRLTVFPRKAGFGRYMVTCASSQYVTLNCVWQLRFLITDEGLIMHYESKRLLKNIQSQWQTLFHRTYDLSWPHLFRF